MPLRSDAHYRGLVEARLREAGICEPPVPVEDFVRRVGVPVMSVTFPAWFTGAIVVEDGMPVILVNSTASGIARRDGIAHLISHVLARIDDPSTPYPRDTEPEHRIAGMMAEELVMPEYLVRAQAAKWFNDYRYLGRLFGVSEADMMARMRALGLLKSRGVLWDY